MKKEKSRKRPSENGSDEYKGGPGTLLWRITNLKGKLKPAQIEKAERLFKSEEYRVVQLAWYMHSQDRLDKRKERMVKRYREGLRKLLGPGADGEV